MFLILYINLILSYIIIHKGGLGHGWKWILLGKPSPEQSAKPEFKYPCLSHRPKYPYQCGLVATC